MIYTTSTNKDIYLCLNYPYLQSLLINYMAQWSISISWFSQVLGKHPSVRVMAMESKISMQICKMFEVGPCTSTSATLLSEFLSCIMKTPSPVKGSRILLSSLISSAAEIWIKGSIHP